MAIEIPQSHRDLLEGPVCAALTTVMPDGQPQTTVIWCDLEGETIRVNTMKGFQKEKNMRRNPRVTILAYEPQNPLRYIEVRGLVVEMTEIGALEHLDHLSELYTGKSPYFGGCVPAEFKATEIPILCRILPKHVYCLDATRKREATV